MSGKPRSQNRDPLRQAQGRLSAGSGQARGHPRFSRYFASRYLAFEDAGEEVAGESGEGGGGAVNRCGALADAVFGDAADIEALLQAVTEFGDAAVDAGALALGFELKRFDGMRIRGHAAHLPAERILRRAGAREACVWGPGRGLSAC